MCARKYMFGDKSTFSRRVPAFDIATFFNVASQTCIDFRASFQGTTKEEYTSYKNQDINHKNVHCKFIIF